MRQFEHATPMDQAESLAISVGHALDLVIKAKGWAVLAVSGGKSPLPMFERLRYRPIRWDAVTVTLVDERAVPPDHADSNGALVRNHLLREGAGVAAWVPLIRDEAEAAEPQRAVARLNGAFQQPDVVVLGMGEDGHTASLFPDGPNLEAALDPRGARRCLPMQAPSVPRQRLSMSLALLASARLTLLALHGPGKLATLNQALAGESYEAMPIRAFLARPLEIYWCP